VTGERAGSNVTRAIITVHLSNASTDASAKAASFANDGVKLLSVGVLNRSPFPFSNLALAAANNINSVLTLTTGDFTPVFQWLNSSVLQGECRASTAVDVGYRYAHVSCLP
jgi:hypothetical protein